MRYAVVGLGHIAQVAVLPAFAHARRNSELAALVSGNPAKRRQLAKKHGVPAFSYEQIDDCLSQVDAVYIALPNSLHAEYTVRAAHAGVHRALYESAETGKAVEIAPLPQERYPQKRQKIVRPAVTKPALVGVASAED